MAVVHHPIDYGLDGRRGAVDRWEERLGNEGCSHAASVSSACQRDAAPGWPPDERRSAGEPDPEHRLARSESMSIVPPCRSTTIRRAMSRPRPVPWPTSLVVKNGLERAGRRPRAACPGRCRAISTTTASPSARVATRRVPAPSIASTALSMRLVHTWLSSPAYASIARDVGVVVADDGRRRRELVAEHHQRALEPLGDVDRAASRRGPSGSRTGPRRPGRRPAASTPSPRPSSAGRRHGARPPTPGRAPGTARRGPSPPARTRRRRPRPRPAPARPAQSSLDAVAGEPVGQRVLAVGEGERVAGAGRRRRARGAARRARRTARR